MNLLYSNLVTRRRFFPVMLLLSLALNTFLFWNIVARALPTDSTAPAQTTLRNRNTPTQTSETASASPAQPFHWSDVSALDPHVLRARLLAAGCPQDTVRLILETVIDRAYLPGLLDNFTKGRGDFWDEAVLIKTPRNTPRDPEKKKASNAFNALLDERDNLLRQLGLPNSNRHFPLKFDEDETDPRISFLSDEKRRAIASQKREIFDLRKEWMQADVPYLEIEAKIAELQRQHTIERSSFLSPEEAEEYNLRFSSHSHLVQNRYSFQPSPEERKAIIKLYEEHQGKVPEAELEKALGTDRFNRFRLSRDEAYESIYKTGSSLNASEDQILRVFELKKSAEAAAQSLRARQNLSTPERNALLRSLYDDTLGRLTKQFGSDGRDLYLKDGGWWINNLQPAQ